MKLWTCASRQYSRQYYRAMLLVRSVAIARVCSFRCSLGVHGAVRRAQHCARALGAAPQAGTAAAVCPRPGTSSSKFRPQRLDGARGQALSFVHPTCRRRAASRPRVARQGRCLSRRLRKAARAGARPRARSSPAFLTRPRPRRRHRRGRVAQGTATRAATARSRRAISGSRSA